MNPSDINRLLAAALAEQMKGQRAGKSPATEEETIKRLLACAEDINRQHLFSPGDIVQYKEFLCDEDDVGPFIVIRVLPEPVFDPKKDSSSARFREPMDIVLGRLSRDGSFLEFHYDSRRFEPYVPKVNNNQTQN